MNAVDNYIKSLSAGEVGGIAFLFLVVLVALWLVIEWLNNIGRP